MDILLFKCAYAFVVNLLSAFDVLIRYMALLGPVENSVIVP